MFADARSLWSSASSAIASLNENISTALEKIDADIDGPEGNSKEVVDQLKADLDTYKAMLEDAQMQHFELSKQSRILVAEKEAELMHLKQQFPNQPQQLLDSSSTEGNTLKYQKLLAEKMILEASLAEAEEKLKLSLHEKNEYLVMKKTHEEVMARFQNVKSDLSTMKVDVDSKDKQKNETIENLVAEYSKLAAESELYQQQCDKRVAEVMKENEILVTKMHALEHSITELADRSVSTTPPVGYSAASSAATPTPSKNNSRSDLVTGSPAAAHSFNSDAGELRETRSKLVNLQFDMKEKENEIQRLKSVLSGLVEAQAAYAATMFPPAVTSNAPGSGGDAELATTLAKLREESSKCEALERKITKLESELENQSRDISRLSVEKREADEAGRKYLEQSKRVQQQYDTLVRAQRQQEESESSSSTLAAGAAAEASAALAAAKLLQDQLHAEVVGLKQQMVVLAAQHTSQLAAKNATHQTAIEQVQSKAAMEVATLRSQLQAVQDSASQGQESVIASMRSEHATQLAAASTAHDQQLHDVRTQLQASQDSAALGQESAIASMRSDHAAQLAAASAAHEQQLDDLRSQLSKELAAVQADRDDCSQRLSSLAEEMQATKHNYDAQIQAAMSGGDAERQSLQAGYVQQISTLQSERDDVSQRLASSTAEISALVTKHESQMQASAASAVSEKQSIATAHAQQIAALENERDEISQRLAWKEDEMSTMKANFEAQIQASMSGSDAEKQQLMTGYTEQIASLKAELSTSLSMLATREQEVATLSAQLADAQASLDVHVQQIATLQAELTTAAGNLATQTQEVSSLSSQLAESQCTVSNQLGEISALQDELAASKASLDSSAAQVEALTAHLSESQSAVADHLQQLDQLTAQISGLEQAATAAEVAHQSTLVAQAEASQRALEAAVEGEREVFGLQLRDVEESIGVLRETHREELIAELDDQRKQLTAEHAAAQQQALSDAAAEAATVLALSLAQQQQGLLEQQRMLEESLRIVHAEDKQAALDANTADLNAQCEEALAAQATAHAEALAQALAALTKEKDTERDSALEQLRQEKKQELDTALQEARDLADAAMLAAKTEFEMRIAELDAQIAGLKADLAVVAEKHKALLSAALSTLAARKDQECQVALAALRAELKAEVDAAYKERDEHLENYSKERKLRKKIHNRLLEIQGNIRVLCRIRPILEVERRSGEDVDVTEVPNEEELYVQRDQQCRTRYDYDRVFPQTSTQEEVFEAVQPLCVSVLDGYNVCIFAYGQTGSGKTFTMEGGAGNKGVSPRAIEELLTQIEQLKETNTYVVTLSMLEIYNETILDLLPLNNSKDKEKLEIRQTGDGGNQVVGLTETTITSMAQVEDLMRQGQKNRAVGSHDMNEHSSRSHSIITLICRGRNLLDGTTTYGKLHLIDLAGSERVGKTDATGDRLKEAQNINKSLSALGEVINALGNKKATHVPYRNSKLTFLLQDSLGGNSKVLTFVNISPAVYNLGETVCSLNFATRCRSTELGQAKKQTGPVCASGSAGEESAVKAMRRATSSTSSLNSSALLTPASKR